MTNQKYPVLFVVLVTCFWGVLIWILFISFGSGEKDSLLLFIPLVLILYRYSISFEFNPFHHNPNFLATDGTIGVVEEDINYLPGGMARLSVSMRKDYIPDDKWYRLHGVRGLMAHLGGKVTMDIIDKAEKFIDVPLKSRGAKEGAVIYLGSPSGKAQLDIFKEYESKLHQKSSELMDIMSQMERAKQLANSMSMQNNKDMKESAKAVSLILRDIGNALPKLSTYQEEEK